MRFFVDADLSERLARGLREFGEDVVHLKDRWQLIEQVVRNWTRIRDLARAKSPPFADRVPSHGTKVKPLPL